MRIDAARTAALLTAVTLIAVVLAGCERAPPEEALRAQIELLQRNIDGRQPAEVAESLADDFVGNEGMDRREAQRLAAGIFLRYRDVGAVLGPLQVRMRGDTHATVAFTVAATGAGGPLLPRDAQVYDVTTGWRNSGDGWRMTSAQWTPRF